MRRIRRSDVVDYQTYEGIRPEFRRAAKFGCSLTLAGYGYPFTQVRSPHLPLDVNGKFDCDVWWNEVARGADGRLMATGHRIADVIALAPKLNDAIARAIHFCAHIQWEIELACGLDDFVQLLDLDVAHFGVSDIPVAIRDDVQRGRALVDEQIEQLADGLFAIAQPVQPGGAWHRTACDDEPVEFRHGGERLRTGLDITDAAPFH